MSREREKTVQKIKYREITQRNKQKRLKPDLHMLEAKYEKYLTYWKKLFRNICKKSES